MLFIGRSYGARWSESVSVSIKISLLWSWKSYLCKVSVLDKNRLLDYRIMANNNFLTFVFLKILK